MRELCPRIERALRIAAVAGTEVVVRCLGSVDHGALPPLCAKRVQRDVGRNARSPRLEAAHPGEGVAGERSDDLLEGLLDEIVVIRSALSGHPKEGLVDDAVKPVVDLGGYLVVTPTDCFDQGFVRRGCQLRLRGIAHEQTEALST